jgi:hypothetical protein
MPDDKLGSNTTDKAARYIPRTLPTNNRRKSPDMIYWFQHNLLNINWSHTNLQEVNVNDVFILFSST